MRIIGQEKIAEVFGVAPKTIVDWQEQGFPISVRGQRGIPSEYDTSACIAWYVERELQKSGANETPRDRLARLQGDEAEMRIRERMGELVPADKIEPVWMGLVTAARSYLRTEPDRLAHLLEASEGVDAKRDLLAETFDEFLRKLSTFDPDDDDEDTRPNAARATAPGGDEAGAAGEDLGSGVG
jgi:phage terminase Nu1 subunit (DNA packaging protein)